MIPCCSQVRLSTLPPDPVIPSKKPFKVELSGGKRYSWCSCGLSRKQVGPLGSSAGSNPVCPLMGSGPPPSPSATDRKKPKPAAFLCHSASSRRKAAPSGCVDANLPTSHRSATEPTSRTSSCLPCCTDTWSPDRKCRRTNTD